MIVEVEEKNVRIQELSVQLAAARSYPLATMRDRDVDSDDILEHSTAAKFALSSGKLYRSSCPYIFKVMLTIITFAFIFS